MPRQLTFEAVDRHIAKVRLGKGRRLSPAAIHADPAAAIGQICPIYKKVRPILELILRTPLLPKKWKDAIRTLMSILDSLCP